MCVDSLICEYLRVTSLLPRIILELKYRDIPGRVITKTKKMLLDFALLNTQHYKVRIKSKVGHSRERSSALPYTSVW